MGKRKLTNLEELAIHEEESAAKKSIEEALQKQGIKREKLFKKYLENVLDENAKKEYDDAVAEGAKLEKAESQVRYNWMKRYEKRKRLEREDDKMLKQLTEQTKHPRRYIYGFPNTMKGRADAKSKLDEIEEHEAKEKSLLIPDRYRGIGTAIDQTFASPGVVEAVKSPYEMPGAIRPWVGIDYPGLQYHVSEKPNLKVKPKMAHQDKYYGKGLFVSNDPAAWANILGREGKTYVYPVDMTKLSKNEVGERTGLLSPDVDVDERVIPSKNVRKIKLDAPIKIDLPPENFPDNASWIQRKKIVQAEVEASQLDTRVPKETGPLNPSTVYPNEPSVKNPKFMQKKAPMRYIRIPRKKLEDKEIRSPLISKPQTRGTITIIPSEQKPTDEEITQITEGLAPKTHYDWVTGIPFVRQYVPVKDILPYETKERGYNKDEKKITEYMALQKYGDMAPIAVSRLTAPGGEPYQAYEGHHRLEAAKRLGNEYILTDVNDINVPLSPGRQLELKGEPTLRWQNVEKKKQPQPLPPEFVSEPTEEELATLTIAETPEPIYSLESPLERKIKPSEQEPEEETTEYAGDEEEQDEELKSLYGD